VFYFKSRYGYEPHCTHLRRFKLKEIAANATPCGYWLSFSFFAFVLFYFYCFYSCNSGKSISRTEATRETPPSPPRYSQGGVVESFYFAIKARLRLGQNKNWCCFVSLRIAFLFLNFIVIFYVIQFSTFIFFINKAILPFHSTAKALHSYSAFCRRISNVVFSASVSTCEPDNDVVFFGSHS
jgi:hypothetical protein